MRIYVLIAGGIAVPQFLGSAATFTLGGFGGPAGRALATGDVLTLGQSRDGEPQCIPGAAQPAIGHHWELAVTEGPHGAPDFFTRSDIDELLSTHYEVHFNSDRTGVRLIGPKPHWARTDGGEAGLHPSNIHDNAYSVGTLDFTGDTPILLGPDGPSLGGFVCPSRWCPRTAGSWASCVRATPCDSSGSRLLAAPRCARSVSIGAGTGHRCFRRGATATTACWPTVRPVTTHPR